VFKTIVKLHINAIQVGNGICGYGCLHHRSDKLDHRSMLLLYFRGGHKHNILKQIMMS
jgi:hypothetical protein